MTLTLISLHNALFVILFLPTPEERWAHTRREERETTNREAAHLYPPVTCIHLYPRNYNLWLSSAASDTTGPDAAALLHTFLLIYRYEPSARYPTLSALNLCCFQEWSLLLLCFMFAFMSELPITYGQNKMKLSEFWLFLPYRLDQSVTPKWFKSTKTK